MAVMKKLQDLLSLVNQEEGKDKEFLLAFYFQEI